ncbi:hypothetical protein EG68_11095 [Paragonimus skrjabini miyazakii]|uniref:LSM domain-containing protein n=1 Tax=Paragonimus skrjabini miyazakii TaxID=59628 RepID=A0A8S9YF22_9TREM|nr:hypothetical protein EG68_11095 [Paragonimus skrjabini miyazakii]
MSNKSCTPDSDARAFLQNLCDKQLTVHVTDGRRFVGWLWCTDNAANLVLGSCVEFPAISESLPAYHKNRVISHSMVENRRSETIRVLYVVVSYWIVSISLVFINKWLLSDPEESPDAPLFITWFQCCVTAGLCLVAANLSSLVPGFLNFPQLKLSSKTALDVLPLSIVFVIMVSFNNLCLKHLNVSFYYLARSLTTVFNVIFTYFILHTSTSRYALLCCGVIVVGYGSGLNVEGSLGKLEELG